MFDCHDTKDFYILSAYPLSYPIGYNEDGDSCNPTTTEGRTPFPICSVGLKWHTKLKACLPEKKVPNQPEGYY